MEAEELKRKLMGLWERTTQSSKELLALLFDYYFDETLVEYVEVDGKILSALCGIPYSFGFGKNRLKGLYIICLTAEDSYHKKGELANLLYKFNRNLRKDYDFTFIVPHSELMADYYGVNGYLNSFFVLEERFTSLHDFHNDYLLSLEESDERIRELKSSLIGTIKIWIYNRDEELFSKEDIFKFIESEEKRGTSTVNICHSYNDIVYLLEENSMRNLNCFVAYDEERKITGIAFTQKEEIKRTHIVASYVDDYCTYYTLLDYIRKTWPDNSISLNSFDPKYQSHSIIQQTYASANKNGQDLDTTLSVVEIPFNFNRLLQPLGMVRILRYDNILSYIAETNSDAEFKLHLRDYREEIEEENGSEIEGHTVYRVSNGKLSIEKGIKKLDKNTLNLTPHEISELLLRKKDSSNLIMEAFGIPRLNLQLRLLPY